MKTHKHDYLIYVQPQIVHFSNRNKTLQFTGELMRFMKIMYFKYTNNTASAGGFGNRP